MPVRKKTLASIHPTADIDPAASIGAGTRVWQFAVIAQGARIGRDCNVGAHCYVEQGAILGDRVTLKNDVAIWEGVVAEEGVFIGPNAIFTNDVYPRSGRLAQAAARYRRSKSYLKKTRLGYGCTIGAGAMILGGISIGRFATVGLGAVVVKPVPDHALVVGNPAKVIGWVCECGLRLSADLSCGGCDKRYEKHGAALGLRR